MGSSKIFKFSGERANWGGSNKQDPEFKTAESSCPFKMAAIKN